MPTPTIYKDLALKAEKQTWKAAVAGLTGVVVCFLAILLPFYLGIQVNLFPIFGVGTMMVIWGWGLFILNHFFGPSGVFNYRRPRSPADPESTLKKVRISVTSWYASITLTFWFAGGTVSVLSFIIATF
jgi:hypothetical protein